MSENITIVDYGMGNLGSIKNMLTFLGQDSIITDSKRIIENSKIVILPGVGKFDAAVKNLHEKKLFDLLQKLSVKKNSKILGICLGMQLMCLSSEEGNLDGLGIINARSKDFSTNIDKDFKVPHMGWSDITIEKNSNLLDDSLEKLRFYFVHSFYVECLEKEDVLSTTNYGLDFVSAFEKDNLIGVQFHPEKSHRFGIKFFKKLIELYLND